MKPNSKTETKTKKLINWIKEVYLKGFLIAVIYLIIEWLIK